MKVTRNTDLYENKIDLVTEPNNYMRSLRQNLQVLMGSHGMSMAQLAEKAGISYETLKSLIYSESKDCKVSTAISLAKAFDISIDELLGSGTIEAEAMESIQIARKLPANYVRFVRWAIRYHERMLMEKRVSHKAVNVMLPEYNNEGNIVLADNFELVDISDISSMIRPKIFLGIKIPCDNYMPHYGLGDILLIANDRNPMGNEVSVIILDGYLWLARRMVERDTDGVDTVNYYSIRDGKFRVNEKDISEHIGYVSGVVRA